MKKHERILWTRFAGHGHYKVAISYYGKELIATVTDMTLIDDYKDEDCTIERKNELYDFVKRTAL